MPTSRTPLPARRVGAAFACLVALAFIAWAGPAGGQTSPTETQTSVPTGTETTTPTGGPSTGGTAALTIEARDTCLEGRAFCLEVVEGNLSDIDAGSTVEVTFRNNGAEDHNLYVARLDDADPTHADTNESVALQSTSENVADTQEETFTFTAPQDAEGVYFWCDRPGHESVGMWLEHDYSGNATGTTGTTAPSLSTGTFPPDTDTTTTPPRTTDDDMEPGEEEDPGVTPGPGSILAAAAGLVAAWAFARRRD